MKNPIIVALDLDDIKEAQKLFEELAPHVGGFKLGPRLTFRSEKSFLRDVAHSGILFFDHKFFDIPSTTKSAVEVAASLGAHWVTVHALSGPECLRELKKLELEIKKTVSEFRILAVTVLTSFSPETLPPIWIREPISKSVKSLAQSALDAGLRSLVCSPEEVSLLRQLESESFLVVPGIRPEGSRSDDQKRVATPKDALNAGASALVIGRPIIAAKDPIHAVQNILQSLG